VRDSCRAPGTASKWHEVRRMNDAPGRASEMEGRHADPGGRRMMDIFFWAAASLGTASSPGDDVGRARGVTEGVSAGAKGGEQNSVAAPRCGPLTASVRISLRAIGTSTAEYGSFVSLGEGLVSAANDAVANLRSWRRLSRGRRR
jgi:hypothetical protein